MIIYGTSFGGSGRGKPREDEAEKYVQVVRRGDDLPEGCDESQVLRFLGSSDSIQKENTFFNWSRPMPYDLAAARAVMLGALDKEAHGPLADRMKLPKDHALRARGQKLIDDLENDRKKLAEQKAAREAA
jgi:hypothetical protein